MVCDLNVFPRGVWDIDSDHSCQVTLGVGDGTRARGVGPCSLCTLGVHPFSSRLTRKNSASRCLS